MQCKDMIIVIKQSIDDYEKSIKEMKKNIHNDYTLALLDIRVIENKQDTLNTYNNILKELEQLQDRIIKRNRGE